ncbi:hypothetical protein [Hoeflea sp.]|uniref:hypothetical protein n=1 Tax=Hoeflea sp. TaxID=1940281 RepID=UPI0025BF393F|nr:hypothetical protein [Hoeflea sp.]
MGRLAQDGWRVFPDFRPANVSLQLDGKVQKDPFHPGALAARMQAAGVANKAINSKHRGVSCFGVDQSCWIDNSISPLHGSIKRNEFTAMINGIE